MAAKYWVKLYHEILDDPKMGTLSDHLYRRVIELFLLAGEYNDNGDLPKVTDMAWRLRTTDDELLKDLEALADKDIICQQNGNWKVTHFEERQAPMEKSEYMRRLREQEIKETYYDESSSVTNGNESVTDYVTLGQTEENRLDKNKSDTEKEQNYIMAFCQITGIAYPFKVSTHAQWIQEVGEWVNLNVARADIEAAYLLAIEKKYTVARPGGLTSFIRGEIAKKNAPKRSKSSRRESLEEMEARLLHPDSLEAE